MSLSDPRKFVIPALLVALAFASVSCSGKPAANEHKASSKSTTTIPTSSSLGTVDPGTTAPRTTTSSPSTTAATTPRTTATSATSPTTTPPTEPPTTTTSQVPLTTIPTPPPPGHCSSGFVCGHVTAIGDSVMLDAQPSLEADIPGIDVNAEVSRQWDEGVQLVQEMKVDGSLGSIVVIDLGTNGPVTTPMFQQMMSALTGASEVVFVTVHLPPSYSWWQSVNDTLEAEVPLYPEDRLANFNALADANPDWFGSDGVHMPIGGPGAQAMAKLIASYI